jgi:GNAT superfamily N-acetyltransferase
MMRSVMLTRVQTDGVGKVLPGEVRAAGHDALTLATTLLQRARLADAEGGIWEAADAQWGWREPQPSDCVEQLFWMDSAGPVAGVLLTNLATTRWECNPIIVPGACGPTLELVWARALEEIRAHVEGLFKVPVRDDDPILTSLVERSGLVAGQRSSIAWMDAAARPPVRSPPENFKLVDRTQRTGTPHPMRHRNGEGVEERLGQCSLYDPELDLAVETDNGTVVTGYSLYWFDPVTEVGLVEPVRVEDAYQRRGLARAMLSAGVDRLAERGAQRVKIQYSSEPAGALYRSLGFRPTASDNWYEGRADQLRPSA